MANDFSGNSNCKALWRFESGALTADSIGTNTLTDVNTVAESTSDYKEGSCCADFEFDNSEYFYITDANLDSGFPLKNGDTNKKISVCFWCKFESTSMVQPTIWAKWDSPSNKRSMALLLDNDKHLWFIIGYNSGQSLETLYNSAGPATGAWYHVGMTYQDSDKSWKLIVWNDSSQAKVINASGTATNNISVNDSNLYVGAYSNYFDGKLDEFVVFNDVLSEFEIDQIRRGSPLRMAGKNFRSLRNNLH